MRVKIPVLILFTIFFGLNTWTQEWLLGTSSNFTSEAFDVKIDSQGNSLVTGYFSGQLNFGDTILFPTNGNSDVFVAKIDELGQLIWAHRFGGAQSDRGIKLALDQNDNIYLTGTFFGAINFGTTTLSSAGNSKDIFLCKLNPDGESIWARKEGGTSGENVYDIILDKSNNIVITGQFEGTSVIGGSTFNSQINPVTSLPSFDLFLAKYSNNGNPIWVKEAHSEYEDRGMALASDANNNIYLTGQFSDTLNFLGTVVNNQIYNAAFLSKITANGDVVYFRKFAASMALPYDIELNDNEEIYITGDFLGKLFYFNATDGFTQLNNPYIRRVFLLKIANNGDYIWGRAQGSNSEVSSRALCLDPNQDVYIGGYFNCTFDQYHDSTLTTGLWHSVGFSDVFVSKFSPAGKLLWNKQNGGKRDDLCYSLANGGNDTPIFAGSYENNFIIPSKNPDLINYEDVGIAQYQNTWPSPNGNPQPNFKYYVLVGDDTKNVFVGKALSQKTPNYYYYRGSITTFPYKSPVLDPNLDIFNTCIKDSVRFAAMVDFYAGPGFDLFWNGLPDPDKNYFHNLTTSGMLYVTANTWDKCYTYSDSILIQLHDKFPLTLTDDRGFNNFKLPQYDTIWLCFPETAVVDPSNLCAGCTFEVRFPDTATVYHSGMLPFEVFDGDYYIRVYNQYGCMRQDTLAVRNIKNDPYELIDPELVLYDTIDFNDSLRICQGDTVLFFITDKKINPGLNFDLTYFEQWAYEGFTELNWNEPVYHWPDWWYASFHWAYIIPDSTGWYKFRYDYGLGYDNRCGIDLTPQTYTDSFYVEVNPLPDANVIISQDGPICPGEFCEVNIVPNIYGFEWDGPGITWQSDDKDSIQVTEAGDYKYSGFLIHPTNGCKKYKEFMIKVSEKSPPPLLRDPFDGTICPNDTVSIWIEDDGLYEWIGTDGFALGTDSLINVSQQGFYYCNYTDPEGCQMVTQQVEIREYTSPSLFASPDRILCKDEEILLTAIFFGVSNVQWTTPIKSKETTITAIDPGTYYCEVTQCGITVRDSVILIDGSFELSLSSSIPKICFGDTATIVASGGFDQYIWNDLFLDDDSLTVYDSGSYWVTVTNELGCTQTSESLSLQSFPESIPPTVADSNICPGASIVLTHNSDFELNWYSDSLGTQLITNGDTLPMNNILQDTIVYAAYSSNNCPLAMGSVMVNVIEPLGVPLIIGNTAVCFGDSLHLETEANDSLSYAWYINGQLVSSGYSTAGLDSMLLFLTTNANLQLVVTDACSSNSHAVQLLSIPTKDMSLNLDSLLLCPETPLELFSNPVFPGTMMWVNGSQTIYADTLVIQLHELQSDFIVGYGMDVYGCKSHPDTVRFGIPNLTFLQIDTNGRDCNGDELLLLGKSDITDLVWTTPQMEQIMQDSLYFEQVNEQHAGLYVLTATDLQFACVLQDSIVLFNHPLPIFNAGSDTALCNYFPLTFYAPDLPYSFYWNDEPAESYTPLFTETILIQAISEFGCSFMDTIFVYLSDCATYGPNIITPNGDGINDFLAFANAELLHQNQLLIINRWGNVMYEQSYYINNWNGLTADGGIISDHVYFYIFYPDGKNGREEPIQGFVHVNGIKE